MLRNGKLRAHNLHLLNKSTWTLQKGRFKLVGGDSQFYYQSIPVGKKLELRMEMHKLNERVHMHACQRIMNLIPQLIFHLNQNASPPNGSYS